jgi:hypothetical protein
MPPVHTYRPDLDLAPLPKESSQSKDPIIQFQKRFCYSIALFPPKDLRGYTLSPCLRVLPCTSHLPANLKLSALPGHGATPLPAPRRCRRRQPRSRRRPGQFRLLARGLGPWAPQGSLAAVPTAAPTAESDLRDAAAALGLASGLAPRQLAACRSAGAWGIIARSGQPEVGGADCETDRRPRPLLETRVASRPGINAELGVI